MERKKEVPENLYEDLELLDMRDSSNETIYDCGNDGLCIGDDGYPGPDAGENDGILRPYDIGENDGRPEFGDGIFGKALADGNIVEVSYITSNGSEANGISNLTFSGKCTYSRNAVENTITSGISLITADTVSYTHLTLPTNREV